MWSDNFLKLYEKDSDYRKCIIQSTFSTQVFLLNVLFEQHTYELFYFISYEVCSKLRINGINSCHTCKK